MHGVGLGLAVADEAMKGFHFIISIENCEGCVKRCLAVNPSKLLSRGSHSIPSFYNSMLSYKKIKVSCSCFLLNALSTTRLQIKDFMSAACFAFINKDYNNASFVVLGFIFYFILPVILLK